MGLRIGTSGWQYRDWRGPFYPEQDPQRLWLATYARTFDTVECNHAFYRLPERATFERWRKETPPGFLMAVKASRFLTHNKRLRDPAEPVARLLERARGLGDRLGPILLQLPPTLAADAGRLDACLACFPSDIRVAVEPRHGSFWTDEIRRVLERRQAALCWADRLEAAVTPAWRTADWGYLRFHAGLGDPPPRYRPATLDRRLAEITRTFGPREEVYVYFNNDRGAAAVADARAALAWLSREAARAQPPRGPASGCRPAPPRSTRPVRARRAARPPTWRPARSR